MPVESPAHLTSEFVERVWLDVVGLHKLNELGLVWLDGGSHRGLKCDDHQILVVILSLIYGSNVETLTPSAPDLTPNTETRQKMHQKLRSMKGRT